MLPNHDESSSFPETVTVFAEVSNMKAPQLQLEWLTNKNGHVQDM
jgi:hypothetical protein